MARITPNRLRVILDRSSNIALQVIRKAADVIGIEYMRIQLNCPVAVVYTLLDFPFIDSSSRSVYVRQGEIGLESDGGGIGLDRGIVV